MSKRIIAMPTFATIKGYSFSIYTADLRERPHVHVKKGNKQIKFWLEPDIELFNPKNNRIQFSPSEYKTALEIVKEHQEEFLEKFKDLQKRTGISEVKRTPNKKSSIQHCNVKCSQFDEYPYLKTFFKMIDKNLIENIDVHSSNNIVIDFVPNKAGFQPQLEFLFDDVNRLFFEMLSPCEGFSALYEYYTALANENDFIELAKIIVKIEECYDGTLSYLYDDSLYVI